MLINSQQINEIMLIPNPDSNDSFHINFCLRVLLLTMSYYLQYTA